METLGLMVLGAIIGAIFSWPISHWYYRRSNVEMPDWAKDTPEWAIPLIEKLPDAPVSEDRLIRLYNEAIESGQIAPHQFTGYTQCPKCAAPQEYFEPWEAWDHASGRGARGFRCARCKYDLTSEDI